MFMERAKHPATLIIFIAYNLHDGRYSKSIKIMAESGESIMSKLFSLKYLSLLILIFQTTVLVLTLRYSRVTHGESMYLSSTAVVMAELIKFVICYLLVLRGNGWNIGNTNEELYTEIILKYKETIKVSVPSFLYTIQNNLIYVSLSYLDAATYSVTYQLKILTTALFSVTLLGKKVSPIQWFAVVLLTIAVALIQWPSSPTPTTESPEPKAAEDNEIENALPSYARQFIGLLSILLACVTSGFSGVYFEKILKGSDTSLWIRNIQLGILGFVFALIGVLVVDYNAVTTGGFFQGYSYIVWSVVLLQAGGGLVIATVIKYADNILKVFATAISIVLSSLLSYFLLHDLDLTIKFVVGTVLVILSIFLYSSPPKPKPPEQPVLKV